MPAPNYQIDCAMRSKSRKRHALIQSRHGDHHRCYFDLDHKCVRYLEYTAINRRRRHYWYHLDRRSSQSLAITQVRLEYYGAQLLERYGKDSDWHERSSGLDSLGDW